jgi:ATP-dependent helicase HrpB
MREETAVVWNRQAERADTVSRLLYGELVLQESNRAPDPNDAAALLAEKALEAGIARFVEEEMLDDLAGRPEFAGHEAAEIRESFKDFCQGRRSFAELKKDGAGFVPWLEQRFDPRVLREDAPRNLRLKVPARNDK